jgi:hypothetical protein
MNNRKQRPDILEHNIQWCFFTGLAFGFGRTHLTYGSSFTRSMMWKMCLKTAIQMSILVVPMNYFLHPLCQWNQTGPLAVLPHEMRFKNYIDKKYDMYKDSDRMFYRSLTSDARLKELIDKREKL